MLNPLYIFDLDETLIAVDSDMAWHEFLVEKGIVTDLNYLAEDRRLMNLYSLGELNIEEYLAFSHAPLRTIATEEIAELVDECIDVKILPYFYSEAKALIASLSKDNTEMLIISATSSFIVHAVAAKLGIKHALGIDLVIEDNCYTAIPSTVPSYREGKVVRLNHWLSKQDQEFDQLYFYTDSINDLPLCMHADKVFAVNPCPKLKHHVQKNRWVELNWGS